MILETVPFQGRNSSSSILSNILTYSFLYSLTFSFFFRVYCYFSVGDWISNNNSITLLCFFLSFSFALAPALTISNFLRYDWTLLSKQSIKLFLMQWYFSCCNCLFVFSIFKFFIYYFMFILSLVMLIIIIFNFSIKLLTFIHETVSWHTEWSRYHHTISEVGLECLLFLPPHSFHCCCKLIRLPLLLLKNIN